MESLIEWGENVCARSGGCNHSLAYYDLAENNSVTLAIVGALKRITALSDTTIRTLRAL